VGLEERDAVAHAAIPVEAIAARSLLLGGRDVATWPGSELAEQTLERRSEQGAGTADRHLALLAARLS
jgi:hypothetical protein